MEIPWLKLTNEGTSWERELRMLRCSFMLGMAKNVKQSFCAAHTFDDVENMGQENKRIAIEQKMTTY